MGPEKDESRNMVTQLIKILHDLQHESKCLNSTMTGVGLADGKESSPTPFLAQFERLLDNSCRMPKVCDSETYTSQNSSKCLGLLETVIQKQVGLSKSPGRFHIR